MPDITAAMVKQLRDRTGAAMMLCKEALVESTGDFDEAVVYIRKKLGAKLSDRGDRVASEGVIAVYVVDGKDAAIIELNSETDFVARADDFKMLAKELAEHVARTKGHSVETVLTEKSLADGNMTVQERVDDVFTRLRERLVFRRFELISTDEKGVLATYVHIPANDRIGVLVELEAPTEAASSSEEAKQIGKEIALQITASSPKYVSREEVPAEVVSREMEIARETAKSEGKPEAAIEKIAEGRLRGFYEESVLLDQPYNRDPKKTVGKLLDESGFNVRRFVRYEVGQGVTGAETSGDIKGAAE